MKKWQKQSKQIVSKMERCYVLIVTVLEEMKKSMTNAICAAVQVTCTIRLETVKMGSESNFDVAG
jgi:hypothetical protein